MPQPNKSNSFSKQTKAAPPATPSVGWSASQKKAASAPRKKKTLAKKTKNLGRKKTKKSIH